MVQPVDQLHYKCIKTVLKPQRQVIHQQEKPSQSQRNAQQQAHFGTLTLFILHYYDQSKSG